MNLNDIHGFAGYVRDRETDSYYANARAYLPQIHRFMAKDKLRVDSLNRYLYVVNNSVNLVDPNGIFSNKKNYLLQSLAEKIEEHNKQYEKNNSNNIYNIITNNFICIYTRKAKQ